MLSVDRRHRVGDSLDLVIITLTAVGFALVIGIPIAVWMGNSKWATAAITPILDVLQTFPAFTYLLPLFILFGLGAAPAVVCTLLYAISPMIRIAAHGVRTVSPATIEATKSLGQTKLQRLTKVQMPMARRTIIVGVNQTTMAALAMATIAAFINGPGLGQPVIEGLIISDVGQAFVPGLAIVIMAIMLDRTTTAISERSEKIARSGGSNRHRRFAVLGAAGIVAAVLVYLSRTYLWAAKFPSSANIGDTMQLKVDAVVTWISDHLDAATGAFKNEFTYAVLNPLQDLLADSPWWLVGAAVCLIAAVLGGRWAFAASVVCLGGIYGLDLWHDAMITLTMCLVATVFVMILAVVFGVLMGRSALVDKILRPLLDAGQTMPPFVYLIPVLAFFGPTRFTSIVAGVIYAAPVAIKLVTDGIKQVAPTTIEAAQSSGSSRFQMITKVQLPMARGSLVLAANQGLLYVLSMVVIGGMVGGGALGYDVIAGFSQGQLMGKGLAAGFAIALLGIMLDRITRRAAARGGGAAHP